MSCVTEQKVSGIRLLAGRLSDEQRELVIEELLVSGPTNSLFIFVAMQPDFLERLKSENYGMGPADLFRRSMFHDSETGKAPMNRITQAWGKTVGADSRWFQPVVLEGIHACILNGPSQALINFLNSEEIRSPNTPIASAVVNCQVLESPESDETPEIEPAQAGAMTAVDSPGITNSTGPGGNNSRSFKTVKWILEHGLPGDRYLDSLGIGSITRFGEERGLDLSICLLDSGADESHPIIQQKISGYVRFDTYGNYKEAYASVDSGCHGTKVSSIMAGRAVQLSDVGLDSGFVEKVYGLKLDDYGLRDDSLLKCGIAPQAKVFEGSILGGAPKKEVGTLNSLMGALDWVGLTSNRNYCCLALCMQLARSIKSTVQTNIDAAIELIQRQYNIPVILAAGNHGKNSRPVSSLGTVVANRDRVRSLYPSSGTSLVGATGTDVMCAQPMLEQLENQLIGVRTGTSFSVAVYAGALAVLCSTDVGRGMDSLTVESVLRASARQTGMINLDSSYEELKRLYS